MQTILVICGTRPEAIKLFPVVTALRAQPGVTVRLCVTGQHDRDMVMPILSLAGLTPDVALDVMAPGQSLDALLGRLVEQLGPVLAAERPARVVVQGDTATALAGAIAGFHARRPVAHVEAGLRSGDPLRPWPEENYRRMIAMIADLHFAPTGAAAAALAREGIETGVHLTGNTVIDALYQTRARRIADSPPLPHMPPLAPGQRLILVTTHRREGWTDSDGILDALIRIAARPDVLLLWPMHPAIRPRVAARIAGQDRIVCTDPLPYPDLVHVLDACHLVLTDSGGLQEEAPALGKPVLVLRDTTERPEAIAAGAARLVGTAPDGIVRETLALLDDPARHAAMAVPRALYGDGHAGQRIATILAASVLPV